MTNFSVLFSPIKIGSMEIKSRFVVPAMGTGLGNPDGTVSQRLIDYWVARAKGGYGLLIVEFTSVDPLGKAIPGQLCIWNDEFVPGFRELVDEVHRHGTKIALQIHHAGRETNRYVIGQQPVAPSPVPCPVNRDIPKELTISEIYDLIEKFGDAALRAKVAGFGAVEIHAAHGYLVAQFMSAYANKRTDEFGGNFKGRMKFAVELIGNIRKKVGKEYPIIIRFSGEERVPGGREINESRVVARVLEEAGVNAVHVSTGVYASMPWIIASSAIPPGYLVDAAAEIKKSVNIPVIAVGRIHDPYLAADILKTGKADMIALGRASLADPEFPNKVAAGEIDDISPCIACMQRCQGEPCAGSEDKGIACLVNPFTGKEGSFKIVKADKPRKIMIIGAGPGGLETAWIAAKRGHAVTVYEKQSAAGGQFRTAAVPPTKHDIARAIKYYIHMGQKHGVHYNYGVEATSELVEKENPDAVILATGGVPLVPGLKGIHGPRVVNAVDILEGKVSVGESVLIIGGGKVGAETADFLGERCHRITMIEMFSEIAKDTPASVRHFLLERLKNYGVTMLTNSIVKTFLEDGIIYEKDGKEQNLTPFDSIVLAMGTAANNPLEEKIKGKISELYVIGDAANPRKASDAIAEGAMIALRI